jgi:hypothetical protein
MGLTIRRCENERILALTESENALIRKIIKGV